MMKLGILKTDTLKPEFVAQFGEYPAMFARYFSAVGAQFELVTYDVQLGQYPESIDDVDGYLITGSKFSVYDPEPWISKLKDFIGELHAAQKKLVGICFGHQVIADALGGKTEKADQGWCVGVQNANLNAAASQYGLDEQAFAIISSHQDQVTKLADGAEVLASTPSCPISAMGIGRHILTFQGHPEFEPAFMQQVLDMRRGIIGEANYLQATASLQLKTDHLLVIRWIADFIQS